MRTAPLSAACLVACLAAHVPASHAGEITVRILLAEGTPGSFGCALFDSDAGFPMKPRAELQQWLTPDAQGRATCTFSDLAPGNYAVSVLNDSNGNREADTDIFGRPKEAWAVSRGVRFRFRPPRFDEASVVVTADSTTTVDAVLQQ
jgi:uncharacterized protein (DUF2141 family)